MRKAWLTVLMLGGGCLLSGCASAVGQQDDQHAPRGLYVGGGGGYVVH